MKKIFFKDKVKDELSAIDQMADPTPEEPIKEELIPVIPKINEPIPELPRISKLSRIPTGINGLDDVLEGGLVPNSIVMVAGNAGTGKTILCTQFIWNTLCMGENGVYVTTSQDPEEVKSDVAIFGRDFNRAEELGQCRIIYVEPQEIKDIVKIILKHVKEIHAKKLVIDSISLICEYAEKKKDIRYNLSYLFRELKKLGVTTLVTSEIEEGSKILSRYGVEEFLVDGIIVLHFLEYAAAGSTRSLIVRKMRRTRHGVDIYPFEISDKGIRVSVH
jgi:KaiC/GvpD/RAD55 family RecA-like ATPase